MSESAAPAYRPIADHLPAVYQEDAQSYGQVRGYLGLLDDLSRAYLAQLDDFLTWLSPEARTVHPPGLDPAGAISWTYEAYGALFDELADWFAFRFPGSWKLEDEEAELDRERDFLLRVARLWRARGTPRGFYAWFCFYFELRDPNEQPFLVEHFKYREEGDISGAAPNDPDESAHRGTLFVPITAFRDHRRRLEAAEVVARSAPAHLLFRVCWVPEGFDLNLTKPAEVREVLRLIADFVPLEDGIHLAEEQDEPRSIDHLGLGALPGQGEKA